MEWGDIILVAVSGSVGVVGAVVGAIVNNHFGRQQMKEAWAEEERRRKSDLRRGARQEDFKMISDAVDGLMELVGRMQWSAFTERDLTRGARAGLGREAYLVAWRARSVTLSLEDQELIEKYGELRDTFNRWWQLVDLNTGLAEEGREEEFSESRLEVERLVAEVRCQIRQLREQV